MCCSSKLIYLLHIKNIRKLYKNNKIKIIAPTWNNEFELPDSSYSVSKIQDIFDLLLKSTKH